jgi:Mg/Co/Ni transporter MgtE
MGCRSDYLEANAAETNSKEAAQHLVYVMSKLKQNIPDYVTKAANNYYGDTSKLHKMVVQLCDILTNLDDEVRDAIVYNGKDKQARQLADWWDEHKEEDRKRIAKENLDKEREALIKQAKEKLTPAEIEALTSQTK